MSSSSGPSQTSGQRLPTQLLLWQEVCCRVVYHIREGGSPLLSVFCGSIIYWTCGKCYGIVKRLPGSLLSKSSHHLTTVKIFRDAIAPRHQRARAARRLCVGSEGPLTRSKWNINNHLQVPRLHREEVQRPIFMEPCEEK